MPLAKSITLDRTEYNTLVFRQIWQAGCPPHSRQPDEISRDYAISRDVDFLHTRSSVSLQISHFIHSPRVILVHQTEVVWLSVKNAHNCEESL